MNRVPMLSTILASLLLVFMPFTMAAVDTSSDTSVDSKIEKKADHSVSATDSELVVKNEQTFPTAIEYLQLMQKAYQNRNYEIIYLSSLQKQLESMQLIHGVVEGQQVSYFRYLNGAIRESLQFDGKISYFEQGTPAYTLQSRHNRHVFANVANFNFEQGQQNYDYVILGKGRIAGKQSIAIRMISKDEYRYSYVVWCDYESFLPLRLDTVSPSNVLLEQLMVVSLKVSENVNPWLAKLTENPRPEVVHIRESTTDQNSQWKANWLPPGFTVVKEDQHKLVMDENEPVSYIMLDDGIVNVSIYISTKKLALDEKQKLIRRGSTVLYTEQKGGVEINIVGDIPVLTAKRLVDSLVLDK